MTQMLACVGGVRNMAIWLLWPGVMSNVHIFVPFKGEQKFSKLFAILTRRNPLVVNTLTMQIATE